MVDSLQLPFEYALHMAFPFTSSPACLLHSAWVIPANSSCLILSALTIKSLAVIVSPSFRLVIPKTAKFRNTKGSDGGSLSTLNPNGLPSYGFCQILCRQLKGWESVAAFPASSPPHDPVILLQDRFRDPCPSSIALWAFHSVLLSPSAQYQLLSIFFV